MANRAGKFNAADAAQVARQGNLAHAEQMYRALLNSNPRNASALVGLAGICQQSGRLEEAERHLRAVVAADALVAAHHLYLGDVLRLRNQLPSAIEAWSAAVKLDPKLMHAWGNLASGLLEAERLPEAEKACRELVRLAPQTPEAHAMLGDTLMRMGRLEESLPSVERAAELAPQRGELQYNAACALIPLHRYEPAIQRLRRARELLPDDSNIILTLGTVLNRTRRFRDAIAELSELVAQQPNHAEAQRELAFAYRETGRLEDAVAAARASLKATPDRAETWHILSLVLHEQGLIDEGIETCRRALAIEPRAQTVHSNLLMLLHYSPGVQPREIFDEHLCWAQQFAAELERRVEPHTNDCRLDRRLRVGYVSHNLYRHAVATFFEPILEHHDRGKFEIFVYADPPKPDAVTSRLRKMADHWRDIAALDDAKLAQLIREDQIDVLVDLIGHADGSRVLALARKPAPVQVTYLGYPDTTGLQTVDYRFTDEWHDPAGQSDSLHTERLIRLAGGAWSYRPDEAAADVSAAPFERDGVITFFSPNKIVKVTAEMLQTWNQVLQRLPGSRLIILTGGDRAGEERIRSRLAELDPSRVELVTRVPPDDYFKLFDRVDITLDTFPYNGHTTSCDSLWMGVPVVTLAGQTHVSRAGVSVLSSVGLPELIAQTPAEYVEVAVALASDRQRLRNLRRALRERMQSSPLMDGQRLAREIERHYRQFWETRATEAPAVTPTAEATASAPSGNIIEQLQRGLTHYEAGQVKEAEAIFRDVLRQDPNQPDGLHILGMICLDTGRLGEAEQLVRRAVAANPHAAQFYLSLGNILSVAGKHEQAIVAWGKFAEVEPNSPQVWASLASAQAAIAQNEHAEKSWKKAIQLAPNWLEPQIRYAEFLAAQRRYPDAAARYQQSLRLDPDNWVLHNGLGVALFKQHRHTDAAAAFARAAQLAPQQAAVHGNFGQALRGIGQVLAAEQAFRKAIELSQSVLSAANQGLTAALREMGRIVEAEPVARESLRLAPDSATGHHMLGNILYDLGRMEDSVACYRKSLELDPDEIKVRSSLLLLLHYRQGNDPPLLFEEHLEWARRHADPPARETPVVRTKPEPDRVLRVGYVSGDFNAHPMAFFFEPILEAHDPSRVHVTLYSNSPVEDEVTLRLRHSAHGWHDVRQLSDQQMQALIREHQIDILVDLSGHIAHNRLLTFARRPAPVQVTYLGYPDTTGMKAMDWRFTDAWHDPPGQTEQFHTEQLYRLPGGAWCWRPRDEMPPVSALPADANRFITFFSPNKFAKVSDEMLSLWQQILSDVPDSRLIVLTGGDGCGEQRVRNAMNGLDASRIECIGRASTDAYFKLYGRADVVLDTFPYNGHTTTCDALWMGLPVISRAGRTHVSRAGLSVLSKVQLGACVAQSHQRYVECAVELAHDTPRLREFRSTLRERIRQYGLTDGTRVAREIEAAYRSIWKAYCETR